MDTSDRDNERSPQEWLDVIERLGAIVPGGVEWSSLSEGLAYVMAGEAAQALVRDLQAEATNYFPDFFEELEGLLARADPAERELLVVGFVEGLQNVSLNNEVPLSRWDPWLRDLTREGWDVISGFWSGKLKKGSLDIYLQTGHR
ncbi:MAG: hypothetical protein HY873_08615 [Chloroflexi bacterium]|nr:hypothetical protein [Chloroflexota bacterium]